MAQASVSGHLSGEETPGCMGVTVTQLPWEELGILPEELEQVPGEQEGVDEYLNTGVHNVGNGVFQM